LHRGRGGAFGGERIVEVGLRNEFLRRERARAIGGDLGVGVVGLRRGLRGRGLAERGLQRRRIDHEQQLILGDVAAFFVHATLQHAGDARAHVGAAIRGEAADEFLHQRHVGLLERDDADFRRRHLATGATRAALAILGAGCECDSAGEREQCDGGDTHAGSRRSVFFVPGSLLAHPRRRYPAGSQAGIGHPDGMIEVLRRA
jgi:hypothetical protein